MTPKHGETGHSAAPRFLSPLAGVFASFLVLRVCVYRGDRARAVQLISGREVQDL